MNSSRSGAYPAFSYYWAQCADLIQTPFTLVCFKRVQMAHGLYNWEIHFSLGNSIDTSARGKVRFPHSY